jgi:hypothetical protein
MKKLAGIIACVFLLGNAAAYAKMTPEQCEELKKKLDKAEETLLPMSDRLSKLMKDAVADKLDAKGKNDLGVTKATYDKKFEPYLKDANKYYDDCTEGAK